MTVSDFNSNMRDGLVSAKTMKTKMKLPDEVLQVLCQGEMPRRSVSTISVHNAMGNGLFKDPFKIIVQQQVNHSTRNYLSQVMQGRESGGPGIGAERDRGADAGEVRSKVAICPFMTKSCH